MTTYQTRLFNSIITTLNQIAHLQSIIDQDTSQMSLHYVTGKLVSDLRQLLAEYAAAGFVIFRCPVEGCDRSPFPVTDDSLADADGWIECEYCPAACDRLLADGTWQSQQVRDKLNARQLEEAR